MNAAELEPRVRRWIDDDPDPTTAAEIQALLDAHDWEELSDRFAGRLRFGTAGLRGAMGGGPNRMNLAVVRAATAALAAWLDARHATGPVVVGYDARTGSRGFAEDAAAVISATGRPALLSDAPCPTPLVAFAVPACDAAAGIVITASHNPAPDNGYKVYDHSGSQIIPPTDSEIAELIAHAGPARAIPRDDRFVTMLPERVTNDYVEMAAGVVGTEGPRGLSIVYTPVHGVGRGLLERTFSAAGFPELFVVPEQAEPDPAFPTAPFPNPEEPGVLDLAIAAAGDRGADLVLANDPDADRLAAAVPDAEGRWRRLTGDELGVLLGWRRLTSSTGDDRVVASSVVSSTWLGRVASGLGVPHRQTLTGFKWISRAGDADGRRLVFGYEEALGYAVTERVRDKDGITAALVFADLVAVARADGRLVDDLLAQLAVEHGGSLTSQVAIRFEGPGASERMTQRMQHLRADAPRSLAGRDVAQEVDLLDSASTLPPSDILVWRLTDERSVIVRPSGTEPKLKCYLEVPLDVSAPDAAALADARDAAQAELRALGDAVRALIGS